MLRRVFTSILIVGVSLIATHGAQAELVNLQTDSGSQGTASGDITFLLGPQVGSFGSAFTPAQFASARNDGNFARNLGITVSSPIGTNALWKPQLSKAGTMAEWISTAQSGGEKGLSTGHTALYAQKFTVAGSATLATIDFSFLIDNALGGTHNLGLFIGKGDAVGVAIPGSVLPSGSDRSNYQKDQFFSANISGLVQTGENYLYVYTVNDNGPTGVQWDADITVVPEPTSFALFGLALVGFARRRR